MTKAWGYVRVSTDDQLRSTLGVRGYIDRIVTYCHLKGFDLGKPCRVNVDGVTFDSYERIVIESESASKTKFLHRKGVKAILEAREAGDILVVAKVDRAFRNMRDAFRTTDKLREMKVPLHFIDLMGADVDFQEGSLVGDILLFAFSLSAQMEATMNSERLKAANRESRLSRGFGCVHTPPIGFKFVGEGEKRRIKPDPEQLALLRQIAAWRKEGYGRFRITKLLQDMDIPANFRPTHQRSRWGMKMRTRTVERFLRESKRLEEIEHLAGLKPEDGKEWLDYYHRKYLVAVEEKRQARASRRAERQAQKIKAMLAVR